MHKEQKLTKIDFILLSSITILYAILSFFHLGSLENPNTFLNHTDVVFEMSTIQEISKIRYFTGHEMGKMEISISEDGEIYTKLENIKEPYVFTWNDIEVGQKAKYIKLKLDEESNIGEIAFYDKQEKVIKVKGKNKEADYLIDEQKTVPKEINYLNSAYFDEIYFARTAYEYAKGLSAYEWVHPPLGKLIMAIPIKLFKMAPFYYRLMGNLAGILMIPVLYIFAKRMFKKTKYALLASIFISMDGFHFAHTRMATVDSFLVLFILLAFLFMYEYFILEKAPLKQKLFKLFLSGFFMGCAICVKWTGLFASMALAILFFIHFFQNNLIFEKKNRILLFCILFFVLIPISMYIALYLCFPNMKYYQTGNIKEIIETTLQMFKYHSTLKEAHPFYSPFYTWPFMYKPVWYYVSVVGDIKSTISGFGNPILWWLSFLSIFYLIYKCFKKDKNAFFLFLIYICMFTPYIRITRGMFLYHYFPVLPFSFLSLIYLIKDITEKTKKNHIYIAVAILVCYFFYYFFPIVSGIKTNINDIENLKWFTTWHF